MLFRKARVEDCQLVTDIVQNTKAEIYPYYYPKEVVDFFANLHCYEHVSDDIGCGTVYVLEENGTIVGTGSYKNNHITRVYVLPIYQGKGYGKYIVEQLELLMCGYEEIYLDASLPACQFYEHLGYKTHHHDSLKCENGVVLVYDVMTKKIK